MDDNSIAFNLNNGSGPEKCVAEYQESAVNAMTWTCQK